MGDVNVNGWVWVCVACDIVKRVWESIQTHDLPPQVFNQMPDSLWASAPRERLALCRCTSAGANVSANNSLPFTKTLFCTVTCLFFFLSFFFLSRKLWQLWSVSQNCTWHQFDLRWRASVLTDGSQAKQIMSWSSTPAREIPFTYNDLTKKKKIINDATDCQKGEAFFRVVPRHNTRHFHLFIPYGWFFSLIIFFLGRWSRWRMKCSVTCNLGPF